jgi:Uma2 family endonuclease
MNGNGGNPSFRQPPRLHYFANEAAMNVQLDLRMEKSEFLAWAQAHEGRYELVEGRVVMMTGGSRGHGTVVRRLANALETRLDSRRWAVWTSDFGVDVGPDTIRYPDVVVDVADGRSQDLTATAPLLVAEVLSPSSVTHDLLDKAAEYLQLPSLSAYLVLAQDEAKAWVWARGGAVFPSSPNVITGHAAIIEIAALAISLPLFEIYSDIGTS